MTRVVGVVAAAFALSLTSSWWDDDVVDTVVWHTFGAVVAVTMWVGVARRPRAERGPWIWIALGLTAWVIGDIAWDVLSWNAPLPDISLADAFYLSGYGFFLIGLLAMVNTITGTIPRDAVLDGLILAVAAGLVFWVTLVRPADDPGSAAYSGVALAYPTFAIALLAVIAWLRLHPERRTLPLGADLLTAAVLLLVVLEPISAWYWFVEPDFDLIPILDRSFQIAFGLMVLAVYRAGERVHRRRRHGLHPLRLLMLGASLAAAPVTMLLVEGSETLAVVAAAIVSTLVLMRFASLSRERERAQQDLAHQATHDPLTGLGNRSKLYETMDEVADERSDDGRSGVALLYLDVDNFKSINDTHGHAVGDALLTDLSHRIRSSLRPGDVASRLGGDEFVIVCRGSGDLNDAHLVAERLTERVAEPFHIGDLSLQVTLSIGLASGATDDGFDQLLQAADAALYKAKRDGRNATVAFDETVGAELDARKRLDSALRHSLAHDALVLQLHPVVGASGTAGYVAAVDASLADGDRVAVDLDLLSEDQVGIARDFVKWKIAEIVSEVARTADPQPVYLRVNALHLCSAELVSYVQQLLNERSVPPSLLIFELRDDEVRRVMRDAPQQIDRLLSAGVQLGVRDFGGPESSLTAARTLPFGVARIDRGRPDLNETIVGSLEALAVGLGLRVVVHDSNAAISVPV